MKHVHISMLIVYDRQRKRIYIQKLIRNSIQRWLICQDISRVTNVQTLSKSHDVYLIDRVNQGWQLLSIRILYHLSLENGSYQKERLKERTSFHHLIANGIRDQLGLVKLRGKTSAALKRDLRYIIVYCRMISFFLSLSLSFSFEEKTDENVINTDGSSNWRDDELSTDIILLYLD